jgi:hypothetical protein
VKSMGNFSRLDRKSLRRQQRMSRETIEETPGIVYEKSEAVKLVTNESHVKVRIVSPVDFPVDLKTGLRKDAPRISKI